MTIYENNNNNNNNKTIGRQMVNTEKKINKENEKGKKEKRIYLIKIPSCKKMFE